MSCVLSPDLHWLLAGGWLSSPAQEGCHQLSHCQAPLAASGGLRVRTGARPRPKHLEQTLCDLLGSRCASLAPRPVPTRVPSDQSQEAGRP